MNRPAYSEILRAWRKEKGLTIEGMAEALGVSVTSVAAWERGRAYPCGAVKELIRERTGIVLPAREAV